MKNKKLLEDINNIVNDKPWEKSSSLKNSAIKTLKDVVSKYNGLINQGKYNLVISSLKRLTEDIQLDEMGMGGQAPHGSGISHNDSEQYKELSSTSNVGSSRIDPQTMKSKIMSFLSKANQIKKLLDANKIPDAFKAYKGLSLTEENIPPNKNRISKDFRIDDRKRKEKYKFFLASFNKLNSNEKAELISLLTSKDSENIKKNCR
jgi:hypothetical protein